ncbi:MAG: helix-turn-helix transcriptional regulator [Lentisphaerae bacterium]|nr:helix-turn-helix transcriptional regulator [Lentisphaerota bacterium]
MNKEDKILMDELNYLKKNLKKVHAEQAAERKAFLENPKHKDMVAQVKANMAIAKAAYDARISAKLTQKELANRLHTKQSYISDIESGKRNVSFQKLEEYAEACDKHLQIAMV